MRAAAAKRVGYLGAGIKREKALWNLLAWVARGLRGTARDGLLELYAKRNGNGESLKIF